MNTFIYDSNNNLYSFKKLSFNETKTLQKKFVSNGQDGKNVDIDVALDVFKEVFEKCNPDYTGDFDNDIIEYNYQEIGLENLLKLINMVFDEVFQSKGANTNKYPFLLENQEN